MNNIPTNPDPDRTWPVDWIRPGEAMELTDLSRRHFVQSVVQQYIPHTRQSDGSIRFSERVLVESLYDHFPEDERPDELAAHWQYRELEAPRTGMWRRVKRNGRNHEQDGLLEALEGALFDKRVQGSSNTACSTKHARVLEALEIVQLEHLPRRCIFTDDTIKALAHHKQHDPVDFERVKNELKDHFNLNSIRTLVNRIAAP